MKIKRNNVPIAFAIVLEAIILKFFQFAFLPEKYFFDSNHILNEMHALSHGITKSDTTYIFTAKFFNYINILGLNTLLSWSICITVIFTLILVLYVLLRKKTFSKHELLFLFMNVGLLNIYVFNLSKDIIQFVIFGIIALILTNNRLKPFWKIIFTCIALFLEGLFFRKYYLLMIPFIITFYILIKLITGGKDNKNNYAKIITTFIVLFFAEIFAMQTLSNENYNMVANARYGVNVWRENDPFAVTIINDPFGKNTNFLIFIANYLVNLMRLMCPIELLLKGMKYIPFIIYQILVTIIVISQIKYIKNSSSNKKLFLSVVISFILMSAIFEPDFGSWVRHESTLFFIYLGIIHSKESTNITKIAKTSTKGSR